ncbi:MAG: hypothetical protein ACOY4H_13210 [Thermodesulfobacteriota bacterium]
MERDAEARAVDWPGVEEQLLAWAADHAVSVSSCWRPDKDRVTVHLCLPADLLGAVEDLAGRLAERQVNVTLSMD